jgi:hypothetical protein
MPEDEFRPKKITGKTISISGYQITTKQIGCYLDVDNIIRHWHQLENEDFPLVRTSSLLVALEYVHRTKKNMVSLLPFPNHIIRMVDAILCVESITGGKQRINNLRAQLCSLITESIKYPDRQATTSNKILEAIVTATDEFRIAHALQGINSSLIFNEEGGSDFRLNGINISIRIEAKSKLNRKYIGELDINEDLIIHLDESTCLQLLSRDAFKSGTLDRAFDEQETDIAVINLSHSEFGDLFAAYVYASNKGYDFDVAFMEAVKLARAGKEAVILYSEVISMDKPYRLGAISSDKETVYSLGAKLDKKEKEVNIKEGTTDYYFRIIEEARRLDV